MTRQGLGSFSLAGALGGGWLTRTTLSEGWENPILPKPRAGNAIKPFGCWDRAWPALPWLNWAILGPCPLHQRTGCVPVAPEGPSSSKELGMKILLILLTCALDCCRCERPAHGLPFPLAAGVRQWHPQAEDLAREVAICGCC